MTVDSKSQTQHLVAPAVSTESPINPRRCASSTQEEEQRALDLASEEERETARTTESRLRVELGHSGPRGLIDTFRRKRAHRLIIAGAKKSSAAAPVKKVRDGDIIQSLLECYMNHAPVFKLIRFEWKHPVLNQHVLGTITVDAGSRAASVTIQRVVDTEHGLCNVTSEIMLSTLLNHWIKYYGKPNIIRTDPEGPFRDQGFRRGVAAKRIRLDIGPGDASWKTSVLRKTLDTSKQEAIRVARRTTDSVTIEEISGECTAAHNDLHRNRGFSAWQLLLGKTPSDKSICESPDLAQCSVEVADEAAEQRLRVKEESYKAHIEEELSLRKRRKEIHQARFGGIGQQVNSADTGDLANTRVPE